MIILQLHFIIDGEPEEVKKFFELNDDCDQCDDADEKLTPEEEEKMLADAAKIEFAATVAEAAKKFFNAVN